MLAIKRMDTLSSINLSPVSALPALEIVRKSTKNKIGKFSKQDIRDLCPSLSISSVEGSLRTLVKEGELMKGGSGKATYYVRLK